MVKLALHSIAYEAKTLNLAKAGYTVFYVDDATGSDSHDGGSWGQAFKTIQHAIDESEPWAKIYIRDGTYSEFITISTDDIELIGESRTGTIINAPSNAGDAIEISSDNVHISSLKAIAISPCLSILATADYIELTTIDFNRRVAVEGDYCIIDDLYSSSHEILISGNRNVVTNCIIENATNGITIDDGSGVAAQFNKIINNEIRNSTNGIRIDKLLVDSENNTISHNNIIGCTTYAKDEGSNNEWFENYYSTHTTDTNHNGLCDTAYSFTTGTDYHPVSKRNGWEQVSLGNVL